METVSRYITFTTVVILLCFIQGCPALSPVVISEQDLWISKDQGEISTYRTPILLSLPNGDLLAFCAPRKYSGGDASAKFIAMRRSSDGGLNWNATRFIEDDYEVKDGLNLGAALVDYDTNTTFVIFGYCQHTVGKCTSPYRPKGVYYKVSRDWGYSWSSAINMADTNPALAGIDWAPGPGFGIQKQLAPNKGRLLACGHALNAYTRRLECLYSDDHGKTWQLNNPIYGLPYNYAKKTGDFAPGENQIVELHNGTILITIRNELFFHCHCRFQALSFDGGESFPVPFMSPKESLIDPGVFASLALVGDVLFLSHPSNSQSRVNMTLHWSLDFGETWPYALQLYPNVAEYSSLTKIDDDHIGVLFERDGYASIDFYKIRIYA
ncbi:sialidase-1-like [Diadema setosum]|uniref:sialidase-1-like n=1 Tax=Diadema setosum TaxID=31175 RepID=UPI003B3A417B